MAVFDSGNNFQVTHGKTGIESNVGFGMADFIVKPVKDNAWSLLFDDLFVGILTHGMINKRWVFDVLDGLDFKFGRFEFASVVGAELAGEGVRIGFVIDGELLLCLDKALEIVVLVNFI